MPSGFSGDPLLLRIRSLGERLRLTLHPLASEAASGTLRAVALARNTGIDTTLAGRLIRALRSQDALATVREIPAPQGLRLFLQAVEGGTNKEAVEQAQRAVEEFELLVGEFPGGRGGLDAAIAGWLPDVRERTEHAAKQTMFRAASQVFGNVCDTVVAANVLHPSEDRQTVDHVFLSMKVGLRRLRVGAPLSISGFMTQQPKSPQTPPPRLETLEGVNWPDDPRAYLVPELCEPREMPLRPLRRGVTTELVLDRDQPPVNQPVTIGWAVMVRNAALRAEPRIRTLGTSSRVPTQLLCFDLLMHADLWTGSPPTVVARLPSAVGAPPDEEGGEIDHLGLTTPVTELGDIDQIGLSEAPRYSEALPKLLARLGLDTKAMRVFRCRVAYPVQFVDLVCRFGIRS